MAVKYRKDSATSDPKQETTHATITPPLTPAQIQQNRETIKALAQAQRGLASYQADTQKSQPKAQSIAPADAPEIVHHFHNAVNAYAADDSYKRIGKNWTTMQKLQFGYLYDTSPKKASEYAASVNNSLAREKTETSRRQIRDAATENPASGILHTIGALGTSSLFSVPEAIDRIAQISARGTTVEKPYLTPKDYAEEVPSAIRDKLNGVDGDGIARKVIDPSIPILGGKGWGDVYSIGFNVAQSWLSANTLGRAYASAGKLASSAAIQADSFARSAVSAMDEARRSGADARQSAAMGLTMGLLEAGADWLPTENLMQITPATTVKEYLEMALKQSALESLPEALSEGLGQAAEYAILGDLSVFSQRRSSYLHRGFTPEQASRKALHDSMNDLGFTMLASAAAGTASAAGQSVLESHLSAIQDAQTRLRENDYDMMELFNLRHQLMREPGYNARFMTEDMKPRNPMEARYAELLTKLRNSQKALDDRKFHEDAIRKAIKEPGYESPFVPELYRMAAEMAAPYGWNNNIKTSEVLDNSTNYGTIDTEFIHKSLGAKSKNYNIYDPESGGWFQFVEGTRIQNSEVFAGKNSKKQLHDGVAEGLTEQHGGTPEKWQHCKGFGTVDFYGEDRAAEVHWFQEETVGKTNFKIKRWLDES